MLNPLVNYELQKELVDKFATDEYDYYKHKGYVTVRYPLSGLVGTEKDRTQTEQHNKKF
jgi:tyrosinase